MSTLVAAACEAAGQVRLPQLLFIGRQDLHSSILAQYLSDALYTTCQFESDMESRVTAAPDSLILIDCKHHDYDALNRQLEGLYEIEPDSRAVLLNATPTSHIEELIHWPCLKGIFFDDCCHELLLKGMRKVLCGDIWIPRRLVESSFERQRMAMPPRQRVKIKLSRREQDILRCIARADSNADIANRLHISEHTVKSHIYNIFRKIDVRNRTEASHWAMTHLLAS